MLTAAFTTNQWMNVVAGLKLPGLPGLFQTSLHDVDALHLYVNLKCSVLHLFVIRNKKPLKQMYN